MRTWPLEVWSNFFVFFFRLGSCYFLIISLSEKIIEFDQLGLDKLFFPSCFVLFSYYFII